MRWTARKGTMSASRVSLASRRRGSEFEVVVRGRAHTYGIAPMYHTATVHSFTPNGTVVHRCELLFPSPRRALGPSAAPRASWLPAALFVSPFHFRPFFLRLTARCVADGPSSSAMRASLLFFALLATATHAATSYFLPLYSYPDESTCWPELQEAA